LIVEGAGIQDFPDVAPRSELTHHHFRLLDVQDVSEAARDLILDVEILQMLRLILDDTPVAVDTLYFQYGSEQGIHQDFPYVQPRILSHLVGCWVACEDVDDESGPFFYLRGSHRLPKFNWQGGDPRGDLTFDGQAETKVADFEAFLLRQEEAYALERRIFHAKKGDVLLWHAALAHGGSPVANRERTRRSLVVHYSSETSNDRDRRQPDAEPNRLRRNGGMIYLPVSG
jgi:ectoine hydroxylase-related dioxygenase (phytanoyl-CoA dioxygenase family)